ncbi:transcriptional regulator, LacI family [Altererythrobacter xiamenensis]|uniref:Transcriptional regulator, LacI family n=1 Tax=Altererythrobacter xiamenensis TaxID=1316679 RepID=A0A1Y6FAP1_9SPHN|nr:LacI family DNA-binding transcriptional regulator [Altererythrobacter xiamenensis]SMQ69842.1 transcriptional regulator, LacI family [Altererythrobacter xiamenensis]
MATRDPAKAKGARLEDIAREAGVSISTVSRALNDHPAVNRRTKQAIWTIAREHDYDFRLSMPKGPIGAEATIAVVVPAPQARETRLADPFLLELLAGITEAARDRNADVLVSHLTPTSEEHLEYALATSRATGVIFIGQSSFHHAFNRLAKLDTRFVVWGANFRDAEYCSIGSDNLLGGERAASHLVRLGRQRILFLGDTEAPEMEQRHRGYRRALEKADIAFTEELTIPAHFDVHSAESATRAALDNGLKFDAVFAASDLIAIGAIRALTRAGVSVPGDVSVVGYDNIPASRYITPRLTTIDQDTGLAGRLLVSKLMDAQGKVPMSDRTETSLLIRESCGG